MGGFVGDVLDTVTDDVLGFDPGGGGIYDVGRDVLGDTIADDILGFDPNGGGIVPVANTAAKVAVGYMIGSGISSALSGATAVDPTVLADATQLASQGLNEAAIAQNLTASGVSAAEAATAAKAGFDAAFIAADAAQLAAQGLGTAAIEQNLVAAGIDPLFAASAAQSASLGGNAVDIAADLSGFSGGEGLFSSGSGSFLDSAGNILDSAGNAIGSAVDYIGSNLGNVLGNVGGAVGNVANSLFSSLSAPSGTANTLAALLASGALTQSDINRLKDLGASAKQDYTSLAQQASEPIQFTPYGVTTSLFSTTPTEGGVTSALTGQGQQLSDAALQAALGSYQQAGTADLNQMTQDRMALYQQLVGPEQERQRLATEARLAAQGRLGIGAGGGEYAPELKALEDAIAKQNLQFAIQAPQEALAQRTALLQQGASAAAIPTGLAGQELQAQQLGGTLGQQATQAAYQRGGLLGQLGAQGISEQLLANIAAAQISSERNKAIGQALQGSLGTSAQTGGSSSGTTGSNLSSLFNTVGSLFGTNTANQGLNSSQLFQYLGTPQGSAEFTI